MNKHELSFVLATFDDFEYIFTLYDRTMRQYVENDWNTGFERIALPAIIKFISEGLFSRVYIKDQSVGALAVQRLETHYQLEELYVEPSCQNLGIGTSIVQNLIAEANAHGKPIRLYVLQSNPARRFWEKNGFVVTGSNEQAYCMERSA